jgi:hypothetical protein
MVSHPLKRETAALDDDWATVGAQHLIPVGTNFRGPQNYGFQTIFALGKN